MNSFHVQIVSEGGSDLGTSYASVTGKLSLHPRLQMELDGSFVWVGDGWQLDGMIYDLGDRIQYLDLKGNCPLAIWEVLIRLILRHPNDGHVVHLPDGGLYELQTFEKMTWG